MLAPCTYLARPAEFADAATLKPMGGTVPQHSASKAAAVGGAEAAAVVDLAAEVGSCAVTDADASAGAAGEEEYESSDDESDLMPNANRRGHYDEYDEEASSDSD